MDDGIRTIIGFAVKVIKFISIFHWTYVSCDLALLLAYVVYRSYGHDNVGLQKRVINIMIEK